MYQGIDKNMGICLQWNVKNEKIIKSVCVRMCTCKNSESQLSTVLHVVWRKGRIDMAYYLTSGPQPSYM